MTSVYAGIVAYAIIKYRLMDIRVAISSAGIFLAVYSLTLGIPIILYSKGYHLMALISMGIFATPAPFIYAHFRRMAEDKLLKEERAYQDILFQASNTFADKIALPEITKSIVGIIDRTIRPKSAAFYLYEGRKYALKDSAGDAAGYAPELLAESPIVSYLKVFGAVHLGELKHHGTTGNGNGKDMAEEVAAFFRSHPASVAVPFRRQDTMVGVLFLGEKQSGTVYSDRDMVVLRNVAVNGALAIENAIHLARTAKTLEEEMHDHRLRDLGAIGSSISHQVGNRLQLVVRFLELFGRRFRKEVVDPATKEELVEKLNRSMDIFPEVIDSAIKAAEISDALRTQGKLSKEPQAVTLKRLVKMARAIAEAKHPSFKYEFVEEFDENLTLWVNESTLQDILFNLFDNSLDSIKTRMKSSQAPEGYVGRIRVAGQTEDTMSVIQVEDNGSGFRAEELKKAFVPFHTTKGSNKGTGLGLYVIQQFIRHSKGTIDVASEPGAGAKFTIKLPLATDERPSAAPTI